MIRRFAVHAAAGLMLLSAAAPALALGMPGAGSGFTVSGKGGPFLKQISGRKLDQAGGAGSLGLASDALNQGQFQAARLPMPRTEASVKAMLDAIEANWPYAKDVPLKVVILGIDYYNAYSLPDGSIVVGFGLLDRAQSDDEVAFVLAHELGHVRLGHFAQQAAQRERRRSGDRLGQVFLAGASVLDGDAGIASRRAGATGDLLHFVNDVMVAPSMSRAQEDEADAVGFDLAQLRPYSAESASARVFDTVQKDEDNRRAISDALDAQLKNELGRAIGAGAVQTLLTGGVSRESMTNGLLKSAGRVALGVAAASQGGPKHRPPEERKKGIADYSAAAYPDGLPLRDEQKTWLQQVRSTQEYADAKVTVEAVRSAMKNRADGRYVDAQADLARASSTPFRSAPMIINEDARLHDDMGDAAAADRLFVMAHQSPDQTVDGYLDHVRMLYRTRQNERAYAIIDEGTRRFNNDDKPFLALLIAVSRQNKQDKLADQYLQRCLSYDDEGLTKDCQLAAGKDGKSGGDGPRIPIGIPRSIPFGMPKIGF